MVPELTTKKVYLAQINTSFGDSAFIPYSVGLLWSAAQVDPRLQDRLTLGGMLYQRLSIDDSLRQIDDPWIVGISCYIWNWEYNNRLAKAIKAKHPHCIVVFGGPEVPSADHDFFVTHPWVDILIHGEGESSWCDLLACLLSNGELSDVKGISYAAADGNRIDTAKRERITVLDCIPSPYLTGVFDDLLQQNQGIEWHASQETHRGCPYSCTFCDWGSAVYTKVRRFNLDRLIEEIKWFGENQISLLYNCDANYGIYESDIDLTATVTAVKQQYGFPSKFRASYAKKSDDKVFQISQLLQSAGMSKGVTLSLQSLSDTTLDAVKRRNIAMNDFAALIRRYREAGMPTYTELILGLPGESKNSWINGLERLLAAGQHDSINIYPCMLLRNSEMSKPESIGIHHLQHARVGISSNHGMANAGDIQEYQNIVIATATMDADDWLESYLLGWAIQSLHCLGLTQILCMDHHRHYGDYIGFYRKLLRSYGDDSTLLGSLIIEIKLHLERAIRESTDIDAYDPSFGQVMWPLEEYTFLRIQSCADRFYDELTPILNQWMSLTYMQQLTDFQSKMILKAAESAPEYGTYDWDFLRMHASGLSGAMPLVLDNVSVCFTADRYYDGNLIDYAREIVWYGRKQAKQKKVVNYVDH